jgi:hypothetical protein
MALFNLSALRRRRELVSYPADLPDRIMAQLAGGQMSFQNLRRALFGMTKLEPDDAESLRRALADLEQQGRIRRFGRGHGSTFYEFTFYEAVPQKAESGH